MPCYQPEESNNEIQSRRMSELIIIFNNKMGIETDQHIIKWSKSYYENHCNVLAPILCEKINSLSKEDLEKIVYNGRDKESRMLADWFDDHDKFDMEEMEL